MKIISTIIIVILLLAGGALWFVAGGSLNDYIKTQIETVGSKVTEQKVSVKKVDMQLAKGAGSIYGINLANPAKYQQDNAFTLGEVTLDINLESLTSSPIIIDAIVIKSPKAFAEITKEGNSNIKDLLDAIERNTPKGNQETAKASDGEEPRISVTKIVLEDTSLTVDLTSFGNKAHTATLTDIHLNNVGGAKGLPASQLGSEIAKQALSHIWQQAKKTQKAKLINKAKEKAKEKLQKETDKLKDKAKKKLGDLFGN